MFKTQLEPRAAGEWFHCKALWCHFYKKREAKTLFIMSAVYGKLRKRTASYPFFRSKIQWGNHPINTHSLAPVNCNMNKSAHGQSPFFAIMQHSSPKKEDYHPGGGGRTLQSFMQGDCARGSTGLTRSYNIFGTTTTNSACDIRGLFRHFRVS